MMHYEEIMMHYGGEPPQPAHLNEHEDAQAPPLIRRTNFLNLKENC